MELSRATTTITKVSDLLEALARMGRPATLRELAEALPFPKPTLRRLLVQLMEVGMVRQDVGDRRYRLGSRLITLAAAVLEELEVRRAATDVLYDLMKATGESVYLTVLDHTSIVYVDVVESESSVKVLTKVGNRRAAWSTATGKVMLAHLDDRERKRRLTATLRPVTAQTVTDPVALAAQLRDIREAGFAISRDEAEVGVTGVAAPVFDAKGHCIAAVGVATPTFRFSTALEERIVEATRHAAKLLSERMSATHDGELASP
ncbi:MAG TPA: IclR family transcriptional regulator [Trueperaceae bacterium]